jgi:hypothetical protein
LWSEKLEVGQNNVYFYFDGAIWQNLSKLKITILGAHGMGFLLVVVEMF